MVTLKRTYLDDRAVGVLTLPDGSEIETLERPWLGNQVSISCIPEGQYKFKRDLAGRFQWWRLLDVPGRTHIEIHAGSNPSHSEGCILMSGQGLVDMLQFFDDTSVEYVLEIKS